MTTPVHRVQVPDVSTRRMPFAVGVVVNSANAAGGDPSIAAGVRAGSRLAVALAAYQAGCFLLDVIEVCAHTGMTSRDWAGLWTLAAQTDAQAVFTIGLSTGERQALDAMATELRLLIDPVTARPAPSRWPDRPRC